MAISILRFKQIGAILGVGKTKLETDFVFKSGGPKYVPGTNDSVERLRLVPLGERSRAAFSDEVERLVEQLRAFRDAQHAEGSKAPPPKRRAVAIPETAPRKPVPRKSAAASAEVEA